MGNLQTMLGILRNQAWERAKGELNSILAAYLEDKERFDHMSKIIKQFQSEVEDNGLAE